MSLKGKKQTKEHRMKISEALKGHSMYKSKERNRKISKSNKGRKCSEETKEKMRLSHLGKKYKPMSDKGKKNLSAAHKGKKLSEEHKKNISNGNTGKTCPEETKLKISLANSEAKNFKWKGENAGYSAIHKWVTRKKGTPSICKKCNRTDRKVYHWSNIDHKYSRNLDDYVRLCEQCHKEYDKKLNVKKLTP